MNPVALKTAQKTGFPVDHIIGNVWSQLRGGRASRPATPPRATSPITTQAVGHRLPGASRRSSKTVYGAGKGNLEDKKRIGSVYHNLGIVNGILNVEAVRIAQAKFGNRTLTGDEVRWGFENLQPRPEARRRSSGADGPVPADQASPAPTTRAAARVTFQQWDGTKWNVVTDWIAARLGAAAADHRGVGGQVRRGEGHHAARLRRRGQS